MRELRVQLANCFGIRKLGYCFDFTKSKTQVIYAPNGTMKTSFARTLRLYARNQDKEIKDRVNGDIGTVKIEVDERSLKREQICVFESEDQRITEEFSKNIRFSDFLASRELKEEYDLILSELEIEKKHIARLITEVSHSTDWENELVNTFSTSGSLAFYLTVEKVFPKLSTSAPLYNTFKYNSVFDKKQEIKTFLELNKHILREYFSQYQDLLMASKIYRYNDGGHFGTYEVAQLLDAVKDEEFFKVNHKIVLQNGQDICTKTALCELIKTEKERILNNENLLKIFEKISAALDKNITLREFKSVLEKDHSLITKLIDYEGFRKEVWIGYLSSSLIFPLISKLYADYKGKKDRIKAILEKANQEQEKWKEIISLYNERFVVPFELNLDNQESIVLQREQTGKLKFKYKTVRGSVETEKEELLNILSQGERRAFYMLQLLFEIEARRTKKEDTLFVLDDVSDSFDYNNKYAILEYLNDIQRDCSVGFYIILLTHNFDFYRAANSRLGSINLMALKNQTNGEICIQRGEYVKNIYVTLVNKARSGKMAPFLCLIPFVRNLVEYMRGADSSDYKNLTSCLHIKDESDEQTYKSVLGIFNDYGGCGDFSKIQIQDNCPIQKLIFEEADSIVQNTDNDAIDIEKKVVLAMATRLRLEIWLRDELLRLGLNPDELKCDQNQTREWIELYKNHENQSQGRFLLLERISIITPEYIHINSFMFEPLIDTSINSLKDLYKRASKDLCAKSHSETTSNGVEF